jgi:transposase
LVGIYLFSKVILRNTNKMKIRKIILLAIRGCGHIKKALAREMGVTLVTVRTWISTGDDNLTKAQCLAIIKAGFAKEGLDLTETEILEETPVIAD